MTCIRWTWIAGALVGAYGVEGIAYQARAGATATAHARDAVASSQEAAGEGGACRTMRQYFAPFHGWSSDGTARVRSPVAGTPVP